MKTILKYLIPAALALVACSKVGNTVETDPAVEPIAWFVEGLASADASNPSTRSWEYTNDATGADVLKFKWADDAYVPGSARFEGYWMANGKWGYDGANGPVMNAILNDENYPTYVEHTAAGDFIHVSLPAAASQATKLLVVYSGSNINHTYWFEDPDYADVSISDDGSAVTLSFNAQNKLAYFVPDQDNNEAIYGVADITPEALTAVGEDGNKAASVDFNFRHLESVFRVRMRNLSNRPLTLGQVYVTAESKKKGGGGEEPFAGQIELTCTNDGLTPVASWGSSWFSVTPATFLPDPKEGDDSGAAVTLPVGEYFTVYMMPLANPACDISDWDFTFIAEGEGSVVGEVTIPGSAIATATQEDGETWTPLKPGYVYTVNMKIVSPYIDYSDGNGNTLHFRRRGSSLTLLAPEDGNVYAGDIEIPETVTVEGRTFTVEAIDSYAFAYQTGLTSVTVPSSVTRVDMAAFKGCTSLVSVTFPEYMFMSTFEMFYGCTSLVSVTLPTSGWYSLSDMMFWNCSSLASLSIPSCINDTLGTGVFTGCTALGGHITSASEYATIDDYGAVYSKKRDYNSNNSYDKVLSWIPENLTGEYTIDLQTARIMTNATRYLALSKLTINNIVRGIDKLNFMETPNLTELKVYWSEYELSRIEWDGRYSNSLPELSEFTFHDWYFSHNSPSQMSNITISVPKDMYDVYATEEPFSYWLERGASIVPRTD